MAIGQRAMRAEDKAARHRAILDAAGRLLRADPDRFASVAEVAREAGLAKGTMYLYFSSKEELLLALHERNAGAFFDALVSRADGPAPLSVEKVLATLRAHMIDDPLFLPLAARCLGVIQQAIGAEIVAPFRARLARRLERAGTGLERHFAGLAKGGGVDLLRQSFALILGLWQLQAVAKPTVTPATDGPSRAAPAFAVDVDRALAALWRGALASSLRVRA
ncbi:MAG TPA: TetR family transcriptional regulator [Casimicrobiaceae bacterium]|jgi:AcrR family transcriptional regulator